MNLNPHEPLLLKIMPKDRWNEVATDLFACLNKLARKKYSELEKCKGNSETRMEALQDLKYKVQEIMTEEAIDIDAYAEQLEERISQFDAVISSLERAVQLLADSEETKSRRREDQEQEVKF